MKVKCFACALVAGTALSAVAMAEPGVKQAGGGVALSNPQAQRVEAIRLPKGSIPGRATYHMATGQWEIHSQPNTVAPQGDVRGPAPFNLVWSSISESGFYTNRIPGGALREAFDWGVVCGDIAPTARTLNQFVFAYATADVPAVPSTLSVDIFLYDSFDPLCVADPDGTLAGFNCLAANGAGYTIGELPGSTAGEVAGWIITIDLTGGFEYPMTGGEFAYSYSNWVNFTNAGPLITNEDQIAAPGTDDAFDSYPSAPQTQPILGTFFFGGAPYAQFYFEIYSSDTVCTPTNSGACCVGETCTVEADEAACLALGGTFTISTPCAAFFCLPAPANDDCLTAQVITGFGQFAYDNRGATSGGEGAASCVTPTEDVWFSWSAPCTGDVTVSTCLLNATDDAFAVYQGSNCGDLTVEVACDDDGCGVVGGQSTFTFAVTQNTNYLIRMGTWGNTAGGQNFMDLVNVTCVAGGFCDADWCQDGSVGVPDIFCFLTDWFANDFDARNYGGTPGVPAIFAFLAEWFSTPQGPCAP